MNNRKQLLALFILVAINAFLAFATYAWMPYEQMLASLSVPAETTALSPLVLGLGNAAIMLVIYGLLGTAGYWLARRLGLPGIYRPEAGWRGLFWLPLGLGAVMGVFIVILDSLFALGRDWGGFTHPPFPFSLTASATAGIGEEVLFRLFVLCLWAFLLNLVLRWRKAAGTPAHPAALWIGNGIAALAFAAAHLPAAMLLLNASTPAELPINVLVELVLLNGALGLVAGQRFMRDGLVAAIGIHFWADIVWHVIFPLL